MVIATYVRTQVVLGYSRGGLYSRLSSRRGCSGLFSLLGLLFSLLFATLEFPVCE